MSIRLPIRLIDSDLPVPSYAHDGDAGLDLFASGNCTIAPGARALIATGIAVAIPEGFAGFVQPRSGRALRDGLSFANSPGLIDSHYRGEIKVIAVNLDRERSIDVARGDRIAQLVIQRIERADLHIVDDLGETARGEGGFGSTDER